MKDFIKQTENELTSLSHTLAGHVKRLESILGKGVNRKLKSHQKLHTLKARSPNTLENQLIGATVRGAGRFLIGGNSTSGSANALGTSNGQMWSDIASLIQKSISRDL